MHPLPRHMHPTIQQMLLKNNDYRIRYSRVPHTINPQLTEAAQNHADYMARTGVFSHYANSGYIARARNAGYTGKVRENIAMGYQTVDIAFNGWRNSSGHWSALISSGSRDAGFGYAVSKAGHPYWVAVYGTPVEEASAADNE